MADPQIMFQSFGDPLALSDTVLLTVIGLGPAVAHSLQLPCLRVRKCLPCRAGCRVAAGADRVVR